MCFQLETDFFLSCFRWIECVHIGKYRRPSHSQHEIAIGRKYTWGVDCSWKYNNSPARHIPEGRLCVHCWCRRRHTTFHRLQQTRSSGRRRGFRRRSESHNEWVTLQTPTPAPREKLRNPFIHHFRNATSEKPKVYVYDNGEETRTYYPANTCLQEIARKLQIATEGKRPWETYISEGLQHLQVIQCDPQFSHSVSTDLNHSFAGSHRQRFHPSGRQHGQIVHEHWQSRSHRSAASTALGQSDRQFGRSDPSAFGADWMRQGYGATRHSSRGIRSAAQSPGHRCGDEFGVGQHHWQLSRQFYLSQRWRTIKTNEMKLKITFFLCLLRNRNFRLQGRNYNQKMAKLCISHGCCCNEEHHLRHGCTDQRVDAISDFLPS